jgi:hypothetical protein
MTIALYASIWAALALLAVAALEDSRPAYAAAALLALVHVLVALGGTYQWDHERAVSETARQAGDVYGLAWRGSIYVNYAFLMVWAVDAVRGRIMRNWAVRAFFLLMIVNGAIVFASPDRRALGVAAVAGLLWAWRPGRRLHA